MRVVLVAQTIFNDEKVECETGYDPQFCADADDLAEFAGRLCYESWNRPNPQTATNKGYLANIIDQGHFSVLEHASATFYIDGVSRNLTHELIRHRHLSFSEVSQRYVNLEDYNWVVPPALRDEPQLRTRSVSVSQDTYREVMEDLDHLPRKEARQAARYYLPSGTETKILVTGNMRAWRDVLSKRLSPTADAEIRLVAEKILAILKDLSPSTFQDFQDFEESL